MSNISPTTSYISRESSFESSFDAKLRNMLPSARELVGNINKVAIPAITFLAFSSFNVISAGPISYATCIAACQVVAVATTGPGATAAFIACTKACLPLAMPFLP